MQAAMGRHEVATPYASVITSSQSRFHPTKGLFSPSVESSPRFTAIFTKKLATLPPKVQMVEPPTNLRPGVNPSNQLMLCRLCPFAVSFTKKNKNSISRFSWAFTWRYYWSSKWWKSFVSVKFWWSTSLRTTFLIFRHRIDNLVFTNAPQGLIQEYYQSIEASDWLYPS